LNKFLMFVETCAQRGVLTHQLVNSLNMKLVE